MNRDASAALNRCTSVPDSHVLTVAAVDLWDAWWSVGYGDREKLPGVLSAYWLFAVAPYPCANPEVFP